MFVWLAKWRITCNICRNLINKEAGRCRWKTTMNVKIVQISLYYLWMVFITFFMVPFDSITVISVFLSFLHAYTVYTPSSCSPNQHTKHFLEKTVVLQKPTTWKYWKERTAKKSIIYYNKSKAVDYQRTWKILGKRTEHNTRVVLPSDSSDLHETSVVWM